MEVVAHQMASMELLNKAKFRPETVGCQYAMQNEDKRLSDEGPWLIITCDPADWKRVENVVTSVDPTATPLT
jgi:hypothetical protein